MKKRVSIGFTVLILLGSSLTPANAVFGLSKCENVKKQVLSLESQINKQSTFWWGKKSQQADLKLIPQLEAYESTNLIGQLWRVQYNNPKCFTRTQNIEIEARKNAKPSDLVKWYVNTVRKKTKKCQSVEQIFSTTPDCVVRKELQINEAYSLPTIYNY
jgi:hypothetical protein